MLVEELQETDMRIGSYECSSLISSRISLDGGAMFGVVPRTLWSRDYPPDEQNRIEMVTRSLLLRDGKDVILIDTGAGDRWDEKSRSIYGIREEKSLEESLNDLGIQAGDVSLVIHTHLHFDHCGGSVCVRDGDLVPRFPNAEYIVHPRHLEWALSPSARDRASFRPDDFIPLQKSGQLRSVDAGEIRPHLELLTAQGHTPYQFLPRVYDDQASLLYCADMVPLSAQIKIPWVMAYDLFPLETVREKEALMSRAAAEGWMLFFEHDARTAAVRIAFDGRNYVISDRIQEFE